MTATLNVLQPSTFETSYFSVYFNIILAGTITASSATEIDLGIVADPGTGFDPTPEQAQMRLALTGTGFTYDGSGNVTGGTITRVDFFNQLGHIASLTGYPISASELFDAFQTVRTSLDLNPIFSILYDRVPYIVNGSDGGDYFGAANLADVFYGNGGDDTLSGAGGNDTIHGGTGNDLLSGDDGDDMINGDAGNDVFEYETGNDQIAGGAGTDFLSFDAAPFSLSPLTIDLATGSYARGADTVTFSGIEGVITSAGGSGDMLFGDAGNNVFVPQGFNITIDGRDGFDRMVFYRDDAAFGAATRDSAITLNAATGRAGTSSAPDNITFSNVESFAGSHYGDNLTGSAADEEFLPMQGADTVDGGAGDDTISYALEQVVFDSGTVDQGVQVDLAAGSFRDTGGQTDSVTNVEHVIGSILDDLITGDAGANTLAGLAGNDRLSGGGGADQLYGNDGADTLIGGAGNDTLTGGESASDLRDLIYGGDGDDLIDGGYGNDELNAGSGNDTVGGGFGADTVYGFDGNDVLTGEAWSDLIYGGAGNDFINGGFGYDRVNGGAGADRFYHLGIADHGSDWIQDYTAADGDVLVFGGGAATGDDFLVQLAETANAGTAGVTEAFVTYVPTGQVLWALIDGGGQAELNLMAGGQMFDLLA